MILNYSRNIRYFFITKNIPYKFCNTNNLGKINESELKDLISIDKYCDEWCKNTDLIDLYQKHALRGGVNVGDRRAIYYLVRALKCKSVLEVGTHVGASTTHIALALRKNRSLLNADVKFITVDVVNVNAPNGPYRKAGFPFSPSEMLNKFGGEEFTEFKVENSQKFLENTHQSFDLIFLDGDHSAESVYNEIPLALNKINENGFILLHDYYPYGRPIWKNNECIMGPFAALDRHIREGANLHVIPLGELGWATKKNSRKTSLALVSQKQ